MSTLTMATVLESVYVDLLFSPSRNKPFSTSTVVVSTGSLIVRAQSSSLTTSQSTATLLQLLTSTSWLTSSANIITNAKTNVISSQTQQTTTSAILMDKVSEGQNASSTIVALAIGLPLGIFCLGFGFVVFFLWLRKRKYNRYPVTPSFSKSSAPAPRRESKIWTRLFNQEPGQHTQNYHRHYDEKYSAESFVSLRDTSATIKYKITSSNPTSQHVQTPQKAVFPVNESYSSNQINTFLYSKPPRIQSIGSALPNLSSDALGERPNLPTNGTWTYESPLSRWFLTKSTYLQDQVKQPLKTSTVKLKQLNILSRVSKNRIQSFLPDETSPILSTARSPVFQESYVTSQLDPLVFRSSSLKYSKKQENASSDDRGTRYLKSGDISKINPYARSKFSNNVIKPQVIDRSGIDTRALLKPLDIQRISTKNSESVSRPISNGRKVKQHNHELKQHLQQLESVKPLPLTPKSRQASENLVLEVDGCESNKVVSATSASDVGLHRIHVVVRSYTQKLTDEITVRPHEHVRLLARHTDGWCLVEKCKPSGSPLHENEDPQHVNIDGEFYLNEYRGIVPGVCLKEVIPSL
ncbi:LAME_0G01354g1_1 [Lachancea meyersii CBS 8951]|uniref:LAME_0G01354g1_1 n=1 Tax=Lachancea meyersii CBS 8951 TaxID=1266667 RepID=A0A1G4K5B1_9SACH|nr:LAME_0G01354g1_1 [Lachancea meyersii CBS 8951]